MNDSHNPILTPILTAYCYYYYYCTVPRVQALLCLKGLFVLMQKHNLEYPQFYARLYGLVTAESLSGGYRDRFVSEFELFLSSSGLPAYLSAAFVKRLCRIALGAPPHAATLALALGYNILLKHAAARTLVHKEGGVGRGSERPPPGAPADPFLPDEQNPAACRAIESSAWEVESLVSHYCPAVSNMARLFAKPPVATTLPVEVSP